MNPFNSERCNSTTLNLRDVYIPSAVHLPFIETLDIDSKYTEIIFSHGSSMFLSQRVCDALVNLMKKNSTITKLSFQGCVCCDQFMIPNIISSSTSLECLDLTGFNQVNIPKLMESLKYNTTVKELHVDGINVYQRPGNIFTKEQEQTSPVNPEGLEPITAFTQSMFVPIFEEMLASNYTLERITGIQGLQHLLTPECRIARIQRRNIKRAN